ncbi:MAG: methylmalonyl-CoA epimerase [Deltaproteobacteria bacterium]|nr:MAG: methylmalonyl-CoA epimerase [Deltaproteobacteria bacterium]
MLEKLDHIGVAVSDLSEAIAFYEGALGIPCTGEEVVATEEVRVAFFPVQGVNLELLEPTSPRSAIQKFLERRGPGIHHICFEVEDIEGALALLSAKGIRLIDERPRPGAHGTRVAFIHPAATGGLLIELKQRQEVSS